MPLSWHIALFACLALKGTSYKTGSATSAFGGHGWMNAMKKYEVKLKVFQHIHWLAPLCGLLSWTCFVKHSARDPSVRWWDKGIRLSGHDLSGPGKGEAFGRGWWAFVFFAGASAELAAIDAPFLVRRALLSFALRQTRWQRRARQHRAYPNPKSGCWDSRSARATLPLHFVRCGSPISSTGRSSRTSHPLFPGYRDWVWPVPQIFRKPKRIGVYYASEPVRPDFHTPMR